MFSFKVVACAKRFSHDWTTCPYTHPAEKARRRDPRHYSYTGIACPELKKNAQGTCPRGDTCPFAHTVFEYWCHPSRYRTQMCNEAAGCKRKVCFFAHRIEELRVSSVKVGSSPEDFTFDGLDPFSSNASNKAAEAILQQMGLGLGPNGSPSSSLDHPMAMSHLGSCSSSRRSSIQLARQRQSIEQSPSSAAATLYGRTSLDVASAEMNLQKLQLAAAQAQLQLQHATALHTLATALNQIQLGSMGMAAPDPQLLLAQQIMLQQDPNLTWAGHQSNEGGLPPSTSLDLGKLNAPPVLMNHPLNSFPSAPPDFQTASEIPKLFHSPWAQQPQDSTAPFGSSTGLYF